MLEYKHSECNLMKIDLALQNIISGRVFINSTLGMQPLSMGKSHYFIFLSCVSELVKGCGKIYHEVSSDKKVMNACLQ